MLSDVNDTLVGSGIEFGYIANDPKKLNCLETFVKCEKIVKWLKEVTKGQFGKNILLEFI